MSFFTYTQNNSGGSFIQDHRSGVYVIVEADTLEEANVIAGEKAGVYFNGVADGIDCECCGDRWDKPYTNEGDDNPSIYGESISKHLAEKRFHVDKGVNFVVIYRSNGIKETI